MPEATVNDISIHYQRSGSGSPVLLLHGLGSSGRDWEHQIAAFVGAHELIVPDFRGHGSSDKPPGPYSIAALSDDTAALLDSLGVDDVSVVGISLGGMVGFQLLSDRPDLVGRLVAVNALQVFETKRISQKIQLAIRKVITRRLSMEKIGEVLSKRLFPDESMVEEREQMVQRWSENDKAAYEATFQAILDWEGVADAMAAATAPITVISSELDYIPPEDKSPYLDAMPTAETIVIRHAHHGVPMEMPQRFNEVLAAVLAGVPHPGGDAVDGQEQRPV